MARVARVGMDKWTAPFSVSPQSPQAGLAEHQEMKDGVPTCAWLSPRGKKVLQADAGGACLCIESQSSREKEASMMPTNALVGFGAAKTLARASRASRLAGGC